jgi:hypothetical protein
MVTFKEFLAEMKLDELKPNFGIGMGIDLRKTKMVWKSTVAAGKKPRTELGVIGLSIGQKMSTGLTSTVVGPNNIHESRLLEASLQGLVKAAMKPGGSIEAVLGDDAEEGAKLLGAKITGTAYVLTPKTDAQKAALKSVIRTAQYNRRDDDADLRLSKLAGARKLLVRGDLVLTSKEQYDDLVEAVGFRFSPSAQIEAPDVEPGAKPNRAVDEPNNGLNKEVRVSEILRKIHASELSIKDEEAIQAALEDRKPTEVLGVRDLDQLAVIANVDPSSLRSLLNME